MKHFFSKSEFIIESRKMYSEEEILKNIFRGTGVKK